MSTITQYARLTDPELAKLRQLLVESPDEAYDLVDETAPGMDTDRAWAGLELNPPVNVISGGTPITSDEWGHDSPRWLNPDEVQTAAKFLAETPFTQLAALYDPAELTAAEVYPKTWDESSREQLADVYAALVDFFHAAAAGPDNVLVWLN
jgi:Domain of unknown function (DUF1877)